MFSTKDVAIPTRRMFQWQGPVTMVYVYGGTSNTFFPPTDDLFVCPMSARVSRPIINCGVTIGGWRDDARVVERPHLDHLWGGWTFEDRV